MACADFASDRQPEAGASARASTAFVQTHETLEDPFAVGLGDTMPIVFDFDPDVVSDDSQLEVNVTVGVPSGVVSKVAQRSRQMDRVPLDADWWRFDCHGDVPEPPEPVGLVTDQILEVDVDGPEPQPVLVGTSQEK